jgi:hypothetical protein
VLYVDVNVYPEFNKSEIVVLRAETIGSEKALKVNGTFSISAINTVSAGIDYKGRKTLNSDVGLSIDVQVPPSRFPLRLGLGLTLTLTPDTDPNTDPNT